MGPVFAGVSCMVLAWVLKDSEQGAHPSYSQCYG